MSSLKGIVPQSRAHRRVSALEALQKVDQTGRSCLTVAGGHGRLGSGSLLPHSVFREETLVFLCSDSLGKR